MSWFKTINKLYEIIYVICRPMFVFLTKHRWKRMILLVEAGVLDSIPSLVGETDELKADIAANGPTAENYLQWRRLLALRYVNGEASIGVRP